jgi:hypothetical protein
MGQNRDVSRDFESRAELGFALGDVERMLRWYFSTGCSHSTTHARERIQSLATTWRKNVAAVGMARRMSYCTECSEDAKVMMTPRQ